MYVFIICLSETLYLSHSWLSIGTSLAFFYSTPRAGALIWVLFLILFYGRSPLYIVITQLRRFFYMDVLAKYGPREKEKQQGRQYFLWTLSASFNTPWQTHYHLAKTDGVPCATMPVFVYFKPSCMSSLAFLANLHHGLIMRWWGVTDPGNSLCILTFCSSEGQFPH